MEKFKKLTKLTQAEQMRDAMIQKYRNKVRLWQGEEEAFADDRAINEVLFEARKQQLELEDVASELPSGSGQSSKLGVGVRRRLGQDSDSEEEPDYKDDYKDEQFYKDVKMDAGDVAALEKFMNKNPTSRLTLAGIIKEKITEKQTEIHTQFSDNGSITVNDIDPRVADRVELHLLPVRCSENSCITSSGAFNGEDRQNQLNL